jgi:propionyl-CoA synthetase
MGPRYRELYRRSIDHREDFWEREAGRIYWHKPFRKVLDYSRPPFCKWFVGGETNLCYNAVDRHLPERAEQPALIYVSSETGRQQTYTYRELHAEVQRMAAVLESLGVQCGDRVLIYLPMVPEAIFAMLATVRLGAIHSVVFGGFAGHSLATRIDDAQPKVIVTADAGMRGGKVIPYKPLLQDALRLAKTPPQHVLMIDRGLDRDTPLEAPSVQDYATLREKHIDAQVPCTWVESSHPSYILYTSGTTGRPKGVQRDTGGYAVALATSMEYIYGAQPGETYFSTSDIGWVVGHSYIVYGPLLHGMSTVVYEGLPIRPDPGVWWKIVQDYKVSVMFSSPTAIRVLKKHDPKYLHTYDISSLRCLFLAGEPLDEPSGRWIAEALTKPVYDHYWQTETGWPLITAHAGLTHDAGKQEARFGSPGFPAYGYDVRLLHELTGKEVGADEKGVVCVVPPLPPGFMSTVWGQDERYVETYYHSFKDAGLIYTTFDWGRRDSDGYYFILGRTDDVINVAGHRLGTREIEEAISGHPAIAEVAVVGVCDAVKGQLPLAFAVPRNPDLLASPEATEDLAREVMALVDRTIGAIGRPAHVYFVAQLPKTRSGKVLRRSIQAISESRDPGDLTSLDDPAGIEQIRNAVEHVGV